ncbi:unnamed protein product [Alopecurus aequalis]
MAELHPNDHTPTQGVAADLPTSEIQTEDVPNHTLPPSHPLDTSDPNSEEDIVIRRDPIEDLWKQASDKLESDYPNIFYKIHRFPASMRKSCEDSYIVPKMVAIGPFYRHLPELQEMEEVKKAAVYQFFRPQDPRGAYEKVVAVTVDARSCYDASALEGITDADFTSMMFHDASFLLLTILSVTYPERCAPPLRRRTGNSTPVVLTDIFLLENQIPWVVLEAIMTYKHVNLSLFMATMGMSIQSRLDREARPLDGSYKPPHLLGLFHFYQSGSMITCSENSPASLLESESLESLPENGLVRLKLEKSRMGVRELQSLPLGTSAIELAEINIKLTPSKTPELKDIGLTKGPIFRKLFLPPLRLNESTACWLMNMAAFETYTTLPEDGSIGEYTVTSYLALFATLMHREEDVHELRAKHLIHGEFTNKQTLDFFKGRHANDLCPGHRFFSILRKLERYKHKCWVWIAIHKFVYNHFKTIAPLLAIIGVIVAVLKVLFSLKKH